jgi:hypothetical protein
MFLADLADVAFELSAAAQLYPHAPPDAGPYLPDLALDLKRAARALVTLPLRLRRAARARQQK